MSCETAITRLREKRTELKPDSDQALEIDLLILALKATCGGQPVKGHTLSEISQMRDRSLEKTHRLLGD